MDAATRTWTDEELMALPQDGYKRELLGGEIVMDPAGSEHGRISVRLVVALERHAAPHKLGAIFDSSTGFRLTPDDLLSPDVAFVSRMRLTALSGIPRGFFPGAPDLVAEVLSPSDSLDRIHAKMERYFAHGCRLAWVLNPAEHNALVYRGPTADRLLHPNDNLDGEDVLPGFRLRLAELFVDLSFE